MSQVLATVRTFVPEQWGELDIFSKFYPGTYEFNSECRKALSGVSSHFRKASVLFGLARKLIPNLSQDREQLQTHGFTPALNSKEFSAVVEGVFTELYSSIDCARKVIVATHRHCRRIPDSTRKLMQRVKEDQVGSEFPEALRQSIVSTDWYEELLLIRDTLTHSDIGYCSLDPTTNSISYTHQGIRAEGKPLIINDVVAKLESLQIGVNTYLGNVFHYLNTTLKPHEVDELCGIFYARGYMRKLRFGEHIDLNAGVCMSRSWFLTEEGYRCPLADSCGAFARAETA
nr:hypothetical protein [uncultured Albidiferax sp.]